MALHSHVQTFKAEIEQKSVLRTLNRAEISHKLRRALCDKRPFFAEFFRIGYAVIAIVGSAKPREFVGMSEPVELAAVDYRASDCRAVSVHILCCRVSDDIRAPLYRTTIYRRCESVVHNERHAVSVRNFCKQLYIEHSECRVCDGFTENRFCVGLESRFDFLLRAVGRDKREIHAHFSHRDVEKIECSAVYRTYGNDVVACVCDIENGVKVCGLSR